MTCMRWNPWMAKLIGGEMESMNIAVWKNSRNKIGIDKRTIVTKEDKVLRKMLMTKTPILPKWRIWEVFSAIINIL